MHELRKGDQPSFSKCPECNVWNQLHYHLSSCFELCWKLFWRALLNFSLYNLNNYCWRNLNTQNISVLLISPTSWRSSVNYSRIILRASLRTAIQCCLAVYQKNLLQMMQELLDRNRCGVRDDQYSVDRRCTENSTRLSSLLPYQGSLTIFQI